MTLDPQFASSYARTNVANGSAEDARAEAHALAREARAETYWQMYRAAHRMACQSRWGASTYSNWGL